MEVNIQPPTNKRKENGNPNKAYTSFRTCGKNIDEGTGIFVQEVDKYKGIIHKVLKVFEGRQKPLLLVYFRFGPSN